MSDALRGELGSSAPLKQQKPTHPEESPKPIRNERKENPVRDNKGFTLIELLVVIAILGVLASIAIPTFAEYRGQSYCSRTVADARTAFTAMEAYYAQYLVYGTLADATFANSDQVSVSVASLAPLTISAVEVTGNCPAGKTYTLTGNGTSGTWGL